MRIHPLRKRACLAGLLSALALVASSAAFANEDTSSALSIEHERYELDNGLTVILHEDHTQPMVVVNVNVNVGSRDERARRTGFAHLFEHLMFMGTERVPEKKFDQWMEREGGWNNAWTSADRTDYYDVGPSHTLPLLLWMEADRLAVLGEQITADKLETQQRVVRNERRQQTEAKPYGEAALRQPELLFPEGHPYHHPVIGSHEDIEAASVEDVKAFFSEWYAPSNISLVVAGDFDPDTTKPRIERWFGAIPKRGAPEHGKPAEAATLSRVVRETLEDQVTFPRITMSWLSPALYEPGDAELDIISEILSSGKSSRLYQKLIYDERVAQDVSCYQVSRLLRSHFDCDILVKPGVPLERVEKLVDEEMARLQKELVSEDELTRARNQYETDFVSRMQSLSTRASLLQTYFSVVGEPDWAEEDLQRYLDVTRADVKETAESVLSLDRRVIMHVVPEDEKDAPAPEQPGDPTP